MQLTNLFINKPAHITKCITGEESLIQKIAKGFNHSKKHLGFKKEADKIANKEGVSKESANAILANSSRNASNKAKKKNLRLKRVLKKH